ncbi:MAG: L-lactate dehydrogenase [Clostridia bacterium]|nr:L-lactate dehydrogenase [Clostridia bacterium]MBO7289673.1 L-lactate dehydrogenase [Clostridia bacterium]
MNKITVIGSGNVGSTISYTLTVMGLASEIVMIDVNEEKSLGEALDIRQGVPFCSPANIYAGSYSDAAGSDIVIITSGMARKPGMSRLDLAQTNVDITKSIADKIVPVAPEATYIIVSNPVDILTYVFLKHTGLPQERVIGSGTILDTARLRSRVSEYYSVNQKNVHAYVLGEHGDSSFVPWSIANISNVPIEDYRNAVLTGKTYPEFKRDEVEEYMRKSGARVIQRKGATFYAVSMSVCHVCQCLLSGIDTTLTVSTLLNGEYGIDDVCLSLLNVVGNKGAHSKIMLPLNDEEIAALHNSANVLKDLIKGLNI